MKQRAWSMALLVTLAVGVLPAWGSPLGAISGTVRDSGGVPQMGAIVEIFHGEPFPALLVYSDAHGHYKAAQLPAGQYQVKVSLASFLPTIRENVLVKPGTDAVVNLTLNTLFEALQFIPVRARTAEDQDDWKWTLRSSASRPILRVLDGSPVVVSKSADGEDRVLKARVEFVAGDSGQGLGGAADQATHFDVQKSIFSSGTLSFNGNLGPTPGSPAVLRASYAHDVDDNRPQVAVTVRRFAAQPSASGSSELQALDLTLSNDMRLMDFAELQYGTQYQAIEFLGRSAAINPFGSFDVHFSPNTVVEYRFASALPNTRGEKGFDSAPADLSESGPQVSVLSGAARIERARHQEVAVSHRLGNNNFQIAAFSDRIANTALAGVGDDSADDSSGAILGDPFTQMFTYDGGSLNTNGIRAVAQHKFSPELAATLDAAYGGALALHQAGLALTSSALSQAIGTEHAAALTAKFSGEISKTKTRWIASYQWNNGDHLLTPVDGFNVSPGQADPYLNLFIRQQLPTASFFPGKMEALVDLRNLLAQGYVPVIGRDGHTLYLVQSARSLRGGLAFNF